MNQEHDDIPASLRRREKEPEKAMQVRIPLSQHQELVDLARDDDQTVLVFIREAMKEWPDSPAAAVTQPPAGTTGANNSQANATVRINDESGQLAASL